MHATTNATGNRIVPPPDFPVQWERPGDERYHWTRDREHMPDPITPMFDSCTKAMAVASRDRAAAALDEAIAERRQIWDLRDIQPDVARQHVCQPGEDLQTPQKCLHRVPLSATRAQESSGSDQDSRPDFDR